MQCFLKYSFIFIFFLVLSQTGFAVRITDDCTGDSSLQPKLYNLQANKDIKNITQENIGATGYYTLKNRQDRRGEAVYRIENAEQLTVKTYSPLASFITVNDSGEPVRGFFSPFKEEIRGRLFTNPFADVILAPVNPPTPQDGNVYYCTAGEFLYEFSRGRYSNPSHLLPYGLHIETSADGDQYHTVLGEFAVTQVNGRGYLEEYQVKLSGETFIRLSISCASTLKDESGIPHDNSVERPINIISVQFDVREKTPAGETSSSSSTSSSIPSESSSSSFPETPSSSDSDTESTPSPVVIHRKSSSSKRKNISYDSDDDSDIDESNEVIQEPFSFVITNRHPPKEAVYDEMDSSDDSDIGKSEMESSPSKEESEISKPALEKENSMSSEKETSQISHKSEQELLFSESMWEEDMPENDMDKFDKLFLGAYSIIILLIVGGFGIRAMKIYCQARYQNPQEQKEKEQR